VQGSERQKPPLHPSREGSRLQSAPAPSRQSSGRVAVHPPERHRRCFGRGSAARCSSQPGAGAAGCRKDPSAGARGHLRFSENPTGYSRRGHAGSGGIEQLARGPHPPRRNLRAHASMALGVSSDRGGCSGPHPGRQVPICDRESPSHACGAEPEGFAQGMGQRFRPPLGACDFGHACVRQRWFSSGGRLAIATAPRVPPKKPRQNPRHARGLQGTRFMRSRRKFPPRHLPPAQNLRARTRSEHPGFTCR
jgi:hypothetical protein